MAITWGDIVEGYGRVGIDISTSITDTHVSVTIGTWFWSKYSISDTSNNYYYNANATSATTNYGSVSLKTSNNSGSGWSTDNQVKLGHATYTYERETSEKTINYAIKLTGVERVGKTMTHTSSVTIPALATYTVSYNANGGSGAPSNQTKYHGIDIAVSSTKPTRDGYTFLGWSVPGRGYDGAYYSPEETIEYNGNQTLVAYWSKTIKLSYDANGGSGAPSAQSATVYNAATSHTFTIPDTTPTRSGYAFLGWSKSSGATSADYTAGNTVGLSSNMTLYAVWRLNVFTVTYDANGGSGAPASQTKTYGTDLKLSSAAPTRKYHAFKGWATSASGSVVYSAGGIYTANAAITLYAVWEVTYIIPRITSVAITRCDENGKPVDDGTYALVKFNWATDVDVSSVKIYWKMPSDTYYPNHIGPAATGRSGSVSEVVGGGALSEDFAYNFKIEVVDNTDFNSAAQTLPATLFPIDMLAGGKGVTIGGPAKEEGLRVKMPAYFEKHIECKGGLEIFLSTPFIDFHHENSTKDYTSRIVESVAGTLSCLGSWSIRDTLNVGGRLYGVNKVLWSGAMHMGESHTATLSEAISAQPHGVVLAFSYYNNGTGAISNTIWNYFFVPKSHVEQHPGTSMVFYTGMSIIRMKCLYLSDTKVVGHADNNNEAYSMHGQTVDNRYSVLRYVIGV